MNYDIIWKSLILIFGGLVLLRLSGRKSISQMTIATTIIMISIGSIIVQPLANQSAWKALVAASIFVGFMLLMEYLQVKMNWLEKLLLGSSKIVVQDGQLVPENLRKLRFTVDQLEMRLRQKGISKISDVKTATLEPNGQLGYELMQHAKPVTMGDLEKLLSNMALLQNNKSPLSESDVSTGNLFNEVKHDRHRKPIPPKLQ
jgi:uncharacterized membrane protein YcaP (DUF421 family)